MQEPGVERPAFSAAEHVRRHEAVGRLLEEHDLGALVVYGAAGFVGPVHYLSDYPPRQPTWLVISPDRPPTLFLHFVNHIPNTSAISTVDDVRCYWPSAVDAVSAELIARGAGERRVGVVGLPTAMPYGQAAELGRRLGGELVDVGADLNRLRWIRSEEEIARIRRSGAIIDTACEDLAAQLRPGLTELDAKAILHGSFVPKGGEEGIIFISGTDMNDPDRRSPWQFPGHRVIGNGHVLITEITINYHGYGAQGHRPFAVGTPPTPLYRELFDVAATCFDRIVAVLRDGATAAEVREAALVVQDRDFLLFDSVLHGETGRNPELGSSGSEHTFEPWTFRAGQVMVVQPNPMTRDGRAGLQAGAAVLIEKDGATPLHGYPLRFHECG
jgi:Xaa-Pro aminopeptidase